MPRALRTAEGAAADGGALAVALRVGDDAGPPVRSAEALTLLRCSRGSTWRAPRSRPTASRGAGRRGDGLGERPS